VAQHLFGVPVESKVQDLNCVVLCDHDIFWFDVRMNNVQCVAMSNCSYNLLEVFACLLLSELRALLIGDVFE
jgi:hypothetical protein